MKFDFIFQIKALVSRRFYGTDTELGFQTGIRLSWASKASHPFGNGPCFLQANCPTTAGSPAFPGTGTFPGLPGPEGGR